LLKPRQEAGAMGIKRCDDAEQVWRWLDQLGDDQSRRLLEQFIPSQVFHVDALVWNGQVIFAVASAYGAPPLDVMHGGGVFVSRTLPAQSDEARALLALNAQVLAALAPPDYCGPIHAEYLRGLADGRWRFLEIGARVGGAHIADAIEFATGINLWEAWAHIELARHAGQPYALPPTRQGYAGVLICLARQAQPDLSAYDALEVVWRLRKPFHAGLIVASPDPARVQALLDDYAARFARDFLARAAPLETGRAV
jgi:biotin carboxylase